MTYIVDLTKHGDELLLGLINYDNVAAQTVWPKAVVTLLNAQYDYIPNAYCIGPTFNNLTQLPVVYKKTISGFLYNTLRVDVVADDKVTIYVDGKRVGTEGGHHEMVTVTIDIEPGEHTVAFIGSNSHGEGFIEFRVWDGLRVMEVSDTSWPCLVMENGDTGQGFLEKDWVELTHENVLLIQPPKANPDAPIAQTLTAGVDSGPGNYNNLFWPKAVENTIGTFPLADPLSMRIEPYDGYVLPNTVCYFRKQLTFEGTSLSITACGDDSWRLYVDGVDVGGGSGNKVETVHITVTPGEHTYDFGLNNISGASCISFVITDGTQRELSDLTWAWAINGTDEHLKWVSRKLVFPNPNLKPFTVVSEGNWDIVTVDKGTEVEVYTCMIGVWTDDVEFTTVEAAKYNTTTTIQSKLDMYNSEQPHVKTLLFDELSGVLDDGNFADRYWPQAEIFVIEMSGWIGPDADCQYISPTALYRAGDSSYWLRKTIEIKTGTVTFGAAADDGWELFDSAGRSLGRSIHGGVNEYVTFDLKPGLHTFTIRVDNSYAQHNDGISTVAFRFQDGTVMHRSDTTWKVFRSHIMQHLHLAVGRARFYKDTGATHNIIVPDGVLYEVEEEVYGDRTTVDVYVKLPHLQNVDVGFEFGDGKGRTQVNTVKVNYNRMDIGRLFSEVSPVGVREVNLDNVDGSIVLNQVFLDELNRRYGVNFNTDDFRITKSLTLQGKRSMYIQAKDVALAYIGFVPVDIIDSLTTRVYETKLVGFTKENVEL